MVISRATTLAALVVAALVAPAAAFALTAGPSAEHPKPSTPAPTHAVTPEADDESTEPAEPDDDASEAADPEDSGTGTPNPHAAAGRAHAEAMQAWAHCVADAASGPKTSTSPIPPKTACGDKPIAPGRAKHLASDSTGKGAHKPKKSHGHGHRP